MTTDCFKWSSYFEWSDWCRSLSAAHRQLRNKPFPSPECYWKPWSFSRWVSREEESRPGTLTVEVPAAKESGPTESARHCSFINVFAQYPDDNRLRWENGTTSNHPWPRSQQEWLKPNHESCLKPCCCCFFLFFSHIIRSQPQFSLPLILPVPPPTPPFPQVHSPASFPFSRAVLLWRDLEMTSPFSSKPATGFLPNFQIKSKKRHPRLDFLQLPPLPL